MKLSSLDRRTVYAAIAAVALVLLLVSVSGLFWILNRSPLALRAGGRDLPAAVALVSRQSPLMLSLLVNPDRLQQLRQFATPPAERGRSSREWQALRRRLLGPKLNYDRDVRPWLGDEISLAVTSLDIDREPGNGNQLGYLLALTTRSASRSREFLQLYWQQRAVQGSELVFEQYQGVPVIYERLGQPEPSSGSPVPTLPQPGLATAVVADQFVLFANHPKVLRSALNNLQVPSLSLASLESYQQTMSRLERRRVAAGFVNLPELVAWGGKIGILPGLTDQPLPDFTGGLGLGLGLERPGLLAESVLVLPTFEAALAAATPSLSQPPPGLNYLPANSLLAIAGLDLNQLWQSLSTTPVISGPLTASLARLSERTGVDLPHDLFGWVTGDYALGLLPSRADSQPDLLFAARKSDPAAVAQSLSRLDDLALNRAKLTVGQLALGDQTVTVWTRLVSQTVPQKPTKRRAKQPTLPEPVVLTAPVVGVHAEVGDYVLFTTSLEAMDLALHSAAFALSSAPEFNALTAALPQPNDGYVYLNWPSSLPLLEARFPAVAALHQVATPLFDHIRSLANASYGGPAGVRRVQTAIALE